MCVVAQASLPEDWEGITDYTGLRGYFQKLERSSYHPRACLPTIISYLDFMGHGARKWTNSPELLEDMLNKTKATGGMVRFLLKNPIDSKENVENVKKIAQSLITLFFLDQQFPQLYIKVYDHEPQFRLMFFDSDNDGQVVVVGHYKGVKGGDSKDSPLQVYEKNREWSFYHAYRSHFDAEWEAAHDVDWTRVRRLAEMGQ